MNKKAFQSKANLLLDNTKQVAKGRPGACESVNSELVKRPSGGQTENIAFPSYYVCGR